MLSAISLKAAPSGGQFSQSDDNGWRKHNRYTAISEGFALRAGVVRAQIVKSTQLRSDELTQRGINDNNKGDSAGFGGHGNQCPGCERLFHRRDHPSAIPAPCRIRSNAGVVDIGAV